jgi:hypothetical protein
MGARMKTQRTQEQVVKPKVGMTLAFRGAGESLAGIPATVVYVWPRFRSGDYLVTLQYAQPVPYGKQFIRHIDAFVSELEVPRTVRSDEQRHGTQQHWAFR